MQYASSKKILFVLLHPGHLRLFDGAVRGLLDRGHTVHIAYEWIEKHAYGAECLQDAAGKLIIDRGSFPARADAWRGFALLSRAVNNYVRYLDPCYANAPYLRKRMARKLPRGSRFLAKLPILPRSIARGLRRACRGLERLIPTAGSVDAYLDGVAPDLVLVSPLVDHRSWQAEVVRSAQALGIPVGLCVGSWDHLTNKGAIRVQPDRVFVWNELLAREARELHDIPREDIVITGAHPFDRWFDRAPTLSREAFCHRTGLSPDRPYVLYTGSTATITRPEAEVEFVVRWVEALREGLDDRFRDVGILVRPHPFNVDHWGKIDFSKYRDVVVFPRYRTNPTNEEDRADFFHSLYYSAAVVGINTSAMVEATILNKPVLTILADEFRSTQQGTLHFHYLLRENGGFLDVAPDFAEHVRQLTSVLASEDARAPSLDDFVGSFIRPRGRDQNATCHLLDEIEIFSGLPPRERGSVPAWTKLGAIIEMYLTYRYNKPHKVKQREMQLLHEAKRREEWLAHENARGQNRTEKGRFA